MTMGLNVISLFYFACLGLSLSFLKIKVYITSQFREFSRHNFFQHFVNLSPFSSLPGVPLKWVLDLLLYAHRFLRHYSFISIFFSPWCADWVISHALWSHSPTLSSVPSNFLLIPFMKVFKHFNITIVLVIVFFSLKLSIWCFLISCISLLILAHFCCFKCVQNYSLKRFIMTALILTSLSCLALHLLVLIFQRVWNFLGSWYDKWGAEAPCYCQCRLALWLPVTLWRSRTC